MAYDPTLAERIRAILSAEPNFEEKRMFGGIAYMLNGNMACGIRDADLVLRLGQDGAASAVDEDNVRYFDFTGKPMKTMVVVPGERIAEGATLRDWLARAISFAGSLPPK